MTKFIDRLDLQIRLHLSVKHLLSIVIFNYGKISISEKLEAWHKLSREEFFTEIESAGISMKSKADEEYLKELFDEQKERTLSIESEINRYDEIVANNKVKI
jgi:hypothetical protein